MSSRQAALLVHALADADKAWVLDQLMPTEQTQLQPLLSELRALGIPEDRALIDVALSRSAPASPSAAPTDDDAYVSGVAAHDITRVLRAESTGFVRKLLACGDWPWRIEVAAALAVPDSRPFDAAHAANAAAFRHSATRLLAQRLRQGGAATAVVRVPAREPATRQPAKWQQRIQAFWRQSP